MRIAMRVRAPAIPAADTTITAAATAINGVCITLWHWEPWNHRDRSMMEAAAVRVSALREMMRPLLDRIIEIGINGG